MEDIRQAVERAKAELRSEPEARLVPKSQPAGKRTAYDAPNSRSSLREVTLDPRFLHSRRIVAFDGKHPHSLPFDILRTEILQEMDLKGWKTLAVTSPTPGCGKTFLAVNLALSMARDPERQVSLVDFDLRRPQVARCLNLKGEEGVVDVLEGRTDADGATVNVRVGGSNLAVMPTAPSSNPSDIVASAVTRQFLDGLSDRGQSGIVILDLPPILTGHDVLSILPHVDCVLLVAAVGTSKVSEIEQCKKYLQSSDIVRFVLNKTPLSATHGYYY
jgi:Mrp family chromosome partitioning ATPase